MLVYLLCRHLEEERLNRAAQKASWNLARSLSAQLTARSLLCWVPPWRLHCCVDHGLSPQGEESL
jgi:hypothetical protein